MSSAGKCHHAWQTTLVREEGKQVTVLRCVYCRARRVQTYSKAGGKYADPKGSLAAASKVRNTFK